MTDYPLTADEEDVTRLAAQFPGWVIEPWWTTAGTSSDRRQLLAHRDGVTVSAWTEAGLARQIREADPAERAHHVER